MDGLSLIPQNLVIPKSLLMDTPINNGLLSQNYPPILQQSQSPISFAHGGINYSTPVMGGQLDSLLKAHQLRMQWQDKMNQLNLNIKPGNYNLNYQRSF